MSSSSIAPANARVLPMQGVDAAGGRSPARLGAGVAAALLAGVVIGVWAPSLWPRPLILGLLLVGAAGWGVSPRLCWVGACLFGMGWSQWHCARLLNHRLPAEWEGREVMLTGVVHGLPESDPRRTRFILRVDDAPANPEVLKARWIQVAWYDASAAQAHRQRFEVTPGSRWRMTLKVRAPRGLSNPGGFDVERHALVRRISATGVIRGEPQALAPGRGLHAWRHALSERIGRAAPPASSRFLQALVLGDTRALQDSDWQVLRATGLTHLIAISGFHVGLVAGFCALLGGLAWRLWAALPGYWPRPLGVGMFALAGAIGYAAVAGFALPTVRTVLMIAVVVLARCGRRRAGIVGCVGLAVMAIVLVDPVAVLQAGFWLSFAGVVWLAWCLPAPASRREWLSGFVRSQWVATIGLLPLTVMFFGQASLVGPVVNLIAIPWWSLVVIPLALVGTAIETVLPGAGQWAWGLAGNCFELSWTGFSAMARSDLALWWLAESSYWTLPLAALGAFCLLLPRHVPGKWLALALWLPLLWPRGELPRHGEAELHVLDVGQGLAAVVRTARHRLLYDAGPAVRDGFDAGERVVVPALRAMGVRRLDRLVVSHGDSDHAGGVPAVLAAIPTVDIHAAPGVPGLSGFPLSACEAGKVWEWDGVRFAYLHPPAHFPYLRNESSCVLKVETAYGAVLLAGDIGHVVEAGLVARQGAELQADVVLAPHHGSRGSSTPAFVSAVGARLMVVSAGYGNRFGHPRAEVVQRWRRAGAEVLDTAGSGAVRIWVSQAGLQVRERRHWRPRLWSAAGQTQPAAILSGIKQAAEVPEG